MYKNKVFSQQIFLFVVSNAKTEKAASNIGYFYVYLKFSILLVKIKLK